MRRLMPTLLLLSLGGAMLVLAGYFGLRAYMHSPVAPPDAAALLQVNEGDSAGTVAARLNELGVLDWPVFFVTWLRLTGDAAKLQAGEYELPVSTTRARIVEQLVTGRVKLYSFTLVEGWSFRDLRDAIARSDILTTTLDFSSPELLAAELELDYPHAEGQFFPDTYRVPRGTADREVLQHAARLMRTRLAAAWAGRLPGLPLQTPYELLILASIIERETALDSERAKVGGVFVRRLEKGMRLQTDPTVIYGLGDTFDGNLTRRDLTTDTAYNTYTRAGLPPTPIAMPGEASLLAAARPEPGAALFFVATGDPDGSHVFSATLDEHNAAVAAYIARLRQARRQREGQD